MNPENKISEIRGLTEKTRLLALNTVITSCFENGSNIDCTLLAEQLESLNHVSGRIKNNPANEPLHTDKSGHHQDIRHLNTCIEQFKAIVKRIKSSYE